MNKLAITTFALAISFAASVNANDANINNTTAYNNGNNGANTNGALAPAAGTTTTTQAPHHHHHHHHHTDGNLAPVDQQNAAPYSEMRIGDPRIVYHEIGTAGAQKGNSIVPFYDEPIRSSKPYEIRYDYAEFKCENYSENSHVNWPWHHWF